MGDGDFKIPISDANFVSAEPFVDTIELTKDYSFLIIACDGLFDKLTAQEVVEFVHSNSATTSSLSEIANMLTDHALSKRSMDNITAVIIKLNWK